MIFLEEDVYRVFLLITEIDCQSGHNCVLQGHDDKLNSSRRKERKTGSEQKNT